MVKLPSRSLVENGLLFSHRHQFRERQRPSIPLGLFQRAV
jgi:hypothetical protein